MVSTALRPSRVLRFILPALALAASLLELPLARGDSGLDFDGQVSERRIDFVPVLERYGEWLETRVLGAVWRPTGVALAWAPYRWGRWEHSDRGWSWVSREPWGWATYHYGRWYLHERLGWLWVPGQEWSPAWVIWRRDAEAVGWAPLPPPGLRVFSPAWTFIPADRMGDQVDRVMVAGPRLPALLLRMRNHATLSSEPPPS